MSLTVLSVAYPLAPVGPDAVGGAEQVLSQVDAALVRAGIQSIVIACEGSRVAGTLIPIPFWRGSLTPAIQRSAHEHVRQAIQCALAEFDVSVIHFHGVDFFAYAPETGIPVIATLHLPPDWYPAEIFNGNFHLHCVSRSQRKACPPSARLLPEIPNGVRIPPQYCAAKDDFALSLGRVCPEKGYHLAAQACEKAGVHYLLAGELFAYSDHEEYYRERLEPLLDGSRRKFVGAIGGACKERMLTNARCVLIPSLVAETSSLVAMEAMAAGTPVVAFRSGALTELVQHGKTGFLVNDVDSMAESIRDSAAISPGECRRYAVENFSAERMTNEYLNMHESIARTTVSRRHLTVERIRDCSSLESLVPEWRALFDRSSQPSPFQSPDWLEPWWTSFGSGELAVLTARNGSDLVGVAPFYIEGGTVRFLGTGNTDYLDVIAANGWERQVADACLSELCNSVDWSLCDFDELRETSQVLTARLPARFEVQRTESSVCPYIDLRGHVLTPKQRRNLRNSRHRLDREMPDIHFETVHDTPDAFIEAFFRLHEARWREKVGTGVLCEEAVRQFHREAIPRLLRAGCAKLHVLRSGDRILATLYCLWKDGCVYYYLGGFDPSLDRLSPGSLLIEYTIEQALKRGDHTLDFLRGEEEYKYTWGARSRRSHRMQLRVR